MKKAKICIGVCLMLSAACVSDDIVAVSVYLFAALLHEIGHLLAARIMKIRVSGIKFDFSGARICTSGNLSYKEELFLSGAGPLANIFAFTLVIKAAKIREIPAKSLLEGAESLFSRGEATLCGVLGFFALSSLLQAASNLMPISGFDGGRMLYCICALIFGDRAAEVVLSITSAIFAFILWTAALYLLLRISAGLGIYIFALGIFTSSIMKKDERV